jgi:hypothetical protein
MSAEATALIARMTALGDTPNSTREGFLVKFIDAVRTNGGLTKLDLLYLLVGHGSAATRVNFAQPGTYDLSLVNTPTFTTDGGWTSAATSYLSSGFNPSSAAGRKMSQNDNSFGAAVLTDASDSNNVKAVAGVANMRTMPRRSTGGDWIIYGGSTTVQTPIAANTGKGLYGYSRSASNVFTPNKNGVALTNISSTSTTPTNATFNVLTSDGTNLTAKQTALVFAGAALTDLEMTGLWDAYVQFMTDIGSSAT